MCNTCLLASQSLQPSCPEPTSTPVWMSAVVSLMRTLVAVTNWKASEVVVLVVPAICALLLSGSADQEAIVSSELGSELVLTPLELHSSREAQQWYGLSDGEVAGATEGQVGGGKRKDYMPATL